MRKELVAGGEQVQECNAEGLGQIFISNLEIEQAQPHAFYTQFFLFDESFSVAFPESFVVTQVLLVKAVEIIHAAGMEFKRFVQVLQGMAGIGVKIPQGMIEVEEEMPVRHPAK